MTIIPAVDIKGGRVVRLTKGKFEKESVYSDRPEEVAARWEKQGAGTIHVVDLDGALHGERVNVKVLERIRSACRIAIQFGGGLRTIEAVKEVLASSIDRAVIGSKALDGAMMKTLLEQFGERIAASCDVRGDRLQIHGWRREVKSVSLEDSVKTMESIGLRFLIYTDVARDGTMQGFNIDGLDNLLRLTSAQVIAAGGISSLEDIKQIQALPYRNLYGVIVGKALYEDRFTLTEAIAAAAQGGQ